MNHVVLLVKELCKKNDHNNVKSMERYYKEIYYRLK